LGNSYRDLILWQKAKRLSLEIYHATKAFPKDELYGLTSQIRRAAVSVVSNVAEGQGRMTTGKFIQFLGHARGSLFELQTQLEIAYELGYIEKARFVAIEELSDDVRALVFRLIESLQSKSKSAGA
jgi:four helix bundle protein